MRAPIRPLRTERLILRPWGSNDIDDLHRLWTDPDVRRFLWDDETLSRERTAGVVTSCPDFWVIERQRVRDAIGFCGFRTLGDTSDIELVYGLAPEYWGRGLVTEASNAALQFAFDEWSLKKVWALADTPNTASIAVMKRLGMRFEDERLLDGRPTVAYSLQNAPKDR
jgi:[ribosomal protein S5]-alanine N-acetyltransferase